MAGLVLGGRRLGCSCFNVANPCSALKGDSVVFIGRALANGGEGSGSGPSRVLVEEWLVNAPTEQREIEIDTAAGTSCYTKLTVGERYVIYAQRREISGRQRLMIAPCSATFLVRGKELLADALKNAARGGQARVVGLVLQIGKDPRLTAMAGAQVVIDSGSNRYVASADSKGSYEIRGIAPGRYQLEVTRSGYESEPLYNGDTSNGVLDRQGYFTVQDGACAVLNLGLWLVKRE